MHNKVLLMLDFSCEFYGSSSKRMKQVFFFLLDIKINGPHHLWRLAGREYLCLIQEIFLVFVVSLHLFPGVGNSLRHRLLIHSVIVAEA